MAFSVLSFTRRAQGIKCIPRLAIKAKELCTKVAIIENDSAPVTVAPARDER